MGLPVVFPDQPLQKFGEKVFSSSPGQRFPWAGQWELTCRCNLKCLMCYTDPFNTPEQIRGELTTEEIFRILTELQEAGCVELVFTGGEPLSRPDFMALYEKAHSLGFFVTVFTNGTLITEAIADTWARFRPKAIEISLHGISAEVFDGVTQVRGSLERCLKGIELLMARKIRLVLKTTALTANRQEILAVKRYVDELGEGVEWRFGQYLRDDLALSGDPFRFQLSERELQGLEKDDPTLWKAKLEELERFESGDSKCAGGEGKFHIDAYGQLQLCSNNRRAAYDLRRGSFRQGFYEELPSFPCPRRAARSC